MEKIAIANQKGGVGKTSVAVNLAVGLAKEGYRVLLIDADPQGNATTSLGIDTDEMLTLSDLLFKKDCLVSDVIASTYQDNLNIIPSDSSLSSAIMLLVTQSSREFILRSKIKEIESSYDYLIIDCAPAFDCLTINVFLTVKKIIIPMELSFFSLDGAVKVAESVNLVNQESGKLIDHVVEIKGIVLNRFDTRTIMSRTILTEIKSMFKGLPFKTTIPKNTAVDRAQLESLSVIDYDENSAAAIAYKKLTKEIIKLKIKEEKSRSIKCLKV